jgi:hypothetical protein
MQTTPGDRAGGSDRWVFLSYAHEDQAWRQRFEVLLKPLVRRHGLTVWTDQAIDPGQRWRPEIETAIARSRMALLLVSADFLASDFIMRHELPALLRHGVRLVPVLVGACQWKAVPELAQVQWLHDTADGPLNLHPADAGIASQRIDDPRRDPGPADQPGPGLPDRRTRPPWRRAGRPRRRPRPLPCIVLVTVTGCPARPRRPGAAPRPPSGPRPGRCSAP